MDVRHLKVAIPMGAMRLAVLAMPPAALAAFVLANDVDLRIDDSWRDERSDKRGNGIANAVEHLLSTYKQHELHGLPLLMVPLH